MLSWLLRVRHRVLTDAQVDVVGIACIWWLVRAPTYLKRSSQGNRCVTTGVSGDCLRLISAQDLIGQTEENQ